MDGGQITAGAQLPQAAASSQWLDSGHVHGCTFVVNHPRITVFKEADEKGPRLEIREEIVSIRFCPYCGEDLKK